MAAAQFDKLASIYDATRSLPEDVMEELIDEISKVLRKYECDSILDVGIGTGRFALPLSRKGFEVTGIDFAREMLKIARGKKLQSLFFANAFNAPFIDKSFDAAMAVHVLHLTSSWKSILQEITRVAKNILVSSGTEWPNSPDIRIEYLHLRRELDSTFEERGLENGEFTLTKLVKPTETIRATERSESIKMDDVLNYFENRGSAITLDTPEKAHREIMGVLKKEYSGIVLERTEMQWVYVWKIENLAEVTK